MDQIERDSRKEEKSIRQLQNELDRLYRCRDLEITNLWQRSVFLAVFLTLTLSGYGALLSNFFTHSIFTVVDLTVLHAVAAALGVLGFTLSVIWVLMAKGSKAWYEVYEGAISQFEEEFGEKLGIPTIYMMGKIYSQDKDMKEEVWTGPKNKKLTCIGAGAYSVSKLNILIGWVFLVVWSVVAFVHGAFLCYRLSIVKADFVRWEPQWFPEWMYTDIMGSIILSLQVFGVVFILIVVVLKYTSRSGYFNLEEFERREKIKKDYWTR